MNTVTFETAKRLKEAGFPQPDFFGGQLWYGLTGSLCVITHYGEYETGFTVINGLREVWTMRDFKSNDAYFAPTATDILPGGYFLCREISYRTPSGERWVVYDRDTLELVCPDGIESDSAAEAAAIAWLKTQDK